MLIAFVVAGGLFTPLADVLRELLDLAAFGGTVVAPGVDRAWLSVAALLARAFAARVPAPGRYGSDRGARLRRVDAVAFLIVAAVSSGTRTTRLGGPSLRG